MGGFTHDSLWEMKTTVLGDPAGTGVAAVVGRRDGDLLSLQTKMKPEAARKPLFNSKGTGVWRGNARLGPTFSALAVSSSFFHGHDHSWGFGVLLFCFLSFFGLPRDHALGSFSPTHSKRQVRGKIWTLC